MQPPRFTAGVETVLPRFTPIATSHHTESEDLTVATGAARGGGVTGFAAQPLLSREAVDRRRLV
jgi:hypothetical protein